MVQALNVGCKVTPVGGVGANGQYNYLYVDANGCICLADGTTVQVEQATIPWQVVDTWTLSLQADEGANDSDKSFTVPAGVMWQVLWIWVELVTTATAGSRAVHIQIQDAAADVIAQISPGAVQAASLTRNYLFAPAMADLTAFRSTSYLSTPIPPTLILPAGYIIRVYDAAAVDAAADDMVVQMMIATRAV